MTQSAGRRSFVALAGAGLALALSVTGCSFDFSVGDPEPAAEEPGTAVEPEEAGPPTGSSPGGDKPSTSPRAGGYEIPVCLPGQLIAELHEQPSDSEEKVLAILTLSNRSTADCVLPGGWAPLGQGGGGGPHYAAVEGAREAHPNPGMRITLRPGATAYAGLKWGTSPECPSADGWAVSWHGSWLPAEVSWRGGQRDICPGTLTQGTLQPSPNTVNYN
ncbi:DUF4232 domain-containing protein [Actinomadura sp. 7K534]|uniref:DUF4232 domain-containing protein n=1 Tax=Actinomadura sp. 7K534 TaxID=2530366 RepID=UPI001050C8A0|nr:DUF4232 domain-containing protein [Actinomadura sp. 7K534]TDB92439.1 DUF4232 domain-containing protein [Actinomadura sp. 7K534]